MAWRGGVLSRSEGYVAALWLVQGSLCNHRIGRLRVLQPRWDYIGLEHHTQSLGSTLVICQREEFLEIQQKSSDEVSGYIVALHEDVRVVGLRLKQVRAKYCAQIHAVHFVLFRKFINFMKKTAVQY